MSWSAYAIGTEVAVALPGRFCAHHWQGQDRGPFQLYIRNYGALERRIHAAC